MTEYTMKQINALIQCSGKECPNHNCICYGDDGCRYEAILSKFEAIIKGKFVNNDKN